jgi:DNA-binding transcriptional regulator LsrR (DeoR family)
MSSAIRDYTRGLRTQAEVARELGISVRQLQRIEDEAVARWLLGIARAMREAIGDFSSEPRLPRRFACRISEIQVEHRDHAQRVEPPCESVSRADSQFVTRRAGLLPRRFSRKP